MSDTNISQSPPEGARFSTLYVGRGRHNRDTMRFRKRLLGAARAHVDKYDDETAGAIERLLGVTVPSLSYGHDWRTFFEEFEMRDVLDAIWIIYRLSSNSEKQHWVGTVATVMREEAMGYRVDGKGGVHFAVDEHFEAIRQAALSSLGQARYAAAMAAFENSHRALDGEPCDTRGAIRHTFEACEVVFRLILSDQVARLGSKEINTKLTPKALVGEPSTHKDAVGGLLRAFATWVDSAHIYRHGQEVEEPTPPPMHVAIASLQIGTAFLRWLTSFDQSQVEGNKAG